MLIMKLRWVTVNATDWVGILHLVSSGTTPQEATLVQSMQLWHESLTQIEQVPELGLAFVIWMGGGRWCTTVYPRTFSFASIADLCACVSDAFTVSLNDQAEPEPAPNVKIGMTVREYEELEIDQLSIWHLFMCVLCQRVKCDLCSCSFHLHSQVYSVTYLLPSSLREREKSKGNILPLSHLHDLLSGKEWKSPGCTGSTLSECPTHPHSDLAKVVTRASMRYSEAQ